MVEVVYVCESGGVGRWYSKGKAAAWGGGQGCRPSWIGVGTQSVQGLPLVFNMNLFNRQSQQISYFISLVFVGLSIVTYYHNTVAS